MKHVFLALLLYVTVPSFSQPGNASVFIPVKGQPARVINWGSRSIMIISDNFFRETKDSIVAQIGQQEFDEMKNRCSNSGWPEGIYKSGVDEAEEKAIEASLNKLKMYRIGAYTHIYNGKTFDRYVILRIPYGENKNWDSAVKWEGNLYFLLKEKDVVVL